MASGRYSTGVKALEEAIAIGEELSDHHMLAFDWVYLGECRLHRGEFAQALSAFDRALGLEKEAPSPIRSMVRARIALVEALRGRAPRLEETSQRPSGKPGAAFLEATNQLLLGWALRLGGDLSHARSCLQEAYGFFHSVGAKPLAIHARMEQMALEIDAGDLTAASKILSELKAAESCGRGALASPMLSARRLLYETRWLLESDGPVEDTDHRLVEAEGYMVGRRFGDLEALARDLRRRLQLRRYESGRGMSVPDSPPSLDRSVQSFLDDLRELTDRHLREFDEGASSSSGGEAMQHVRQYRERLLSLTRAIEGQGPDATRHRPSIVGRSPATRELIATIRQVGPSRLPILISGETGNRQGDHRERHPRRELP